MVLHRQLGSNWGTDGWFRTMWYVDPNDGVTKPGGGQLGLTDLRIDAKTGEFLRWNGVTGTRHPGVSANRAGWASGPVSRPYGEGVAFINKYGEDAVNRDQRSIEIDRNYDSLLAEIALMRIAQITAHDAHNYGITWEDFPIAPQDGFSFVRWHQEYTIGTGKVCPGPVVMKLTTRLIAITKELMRQYQTGEIGGTPEPTPLTAKAIFVPFPEQGGRVFHTVPGAVARHWGNLAAPIKRRFTERTAIRCVGSCEAVHGDARWLLITSRGASNRARIHASGVAEHFPAHVPSPQP